MVRPPQPGAPATLSIMSRPPGMPTDREVLWLPLTETGARITEPHTALVSHDTTRVRGAAIRARPHGHHRPSGDRAAGRARAGRAAALRDLRLLHLPRVRDDGL